jgi:fructose-specific phosphotransferase system IIC component
MVSGADLLGSLVVVMIFIFIAIGPIATVVKKLDDWMNRPKG